MVFFTNSYSQPGLFDPFWRYSAKYSCNFLHERRIEIKFLPISSTVYCAPEELDFVSVCLKNFSVRPITFVNRRKAILTAENLLLSAARFKACLLVVA